MAGTSIQAYGSKQVQLKEHLKAGAASGWPEAYASSPLSTNSERQRSRGDDRSVLRCMTFRSIVSCGHEVDRVDIRQPDVNPYQTTMRGDKRNG